MKDDGNYRNPVLSGFYPDPSVCRVGRDYYLVNSSFEYFPGVPLFHSRNLVNWRQVGHCLTRPSQLPLEKAPASAGIFAPTIRHHDGVFYMVTTNVSGGGNFYVYTRDIQGEWSEPVWVDQPGIDPSLFFDDDGTVYFTSTGETGISQSEIDIATGKRLTAIQMIWPGTGGSYPEAPHLFKKDGVYYLMIAEGGTEYGHMVTIARSDSPWGPFEGCSRNPILTHRSTIRPIQATGHADLLQDHNGHWWLVFLGIRPSDWERHHHLGRETFLAPVVWDDDGWPVIGDNGTAAMTMSGEKLPGPFEDTHPADVDDDFDSAELGLAWNFLRNPRAEDWSLTDRPGWLRLNGSAVSLDDVDSPAFVGRRQRLFECRVETVLEFEPTDSNEEAGLTVWMNEKHHYEAAVTMREGRKVVILRRRIGMLRVEEACLPLDTACAVRLRVDADKLTYVFSVDPGDGCWVELGRGETRYLSKEVAGGFTGVYWGLYAGGHGRRCRSAAYFDRFSIEAVNA